MKHLEILFEVSKESDVLGNVVEITKANVEITTDPAPAGTQRLVKDRNIEACTLPKVLNRIIWKVEILRLIDSTRLRIWGTFACVQLAQVLIMLIIKQESRSWSIYQSGKTEFMIIQHADFKIDIGMLKER